MKMTKKLVIDAGHGLPNDPGASYNGLKEAKLTLKIAKKIRKKLKKYDVKVKMTRSTNKFLTLTERTNIANNWGADAFISVHINSGGGTGFESFIYSGGTSSNTKTLQNKVHAAIMSQIDVKDRGKKQANFAVVRQTTMPAILTENLFVDGDNKLLKKNKVLNQLADGHVAGIADYFGLAKGKKDKPKKSKPKKKPAKKKPAKKKSKKATGKIADIQKWLNSYGNYGLAVDNIAGQATKKALVKAYQNELNKQFNTGLVVDGLWGVKTRNATVTVRKGAKGNLSRILQMALVIKGHNIAIDGIFGKDTYNAVKSFQKKFGLAVDGTPGKATFAKLLA